MGNSVKTGQCSKKVKVDDKVNTLRICGTCEYANTRLEPAEVQVLNLKVSVVYQDRVLLRRSNIKHLKDKKVLCRKEKIKVSILERGCIFWK